MDEQVIWTNHHRTGRILVLLAAAFAVLVMSTWNLYAALRRVGEVVEERAAARAARLQLGQEAALVSDMEEGGRSYIFTGDADYLSRYQLAREALVAQSARMEAGLAAEPAMQSAWAELSAMIRQRLDGLEQGIARRAKRNEWTADDLALIEEGRRTMRIVQTRFEAIDSRLAGQVGHLTQVLGQAQQRADRWFWGANGLSLLFLSLAGYFLWREHRMRIRLEIRLRSANRELESSVAARTAELASAHDRIARFAAEQDRTIESERQRVARDVHDHLGQVFTAIKLIFQSIPPSAFPPGLAASLSEALETGIASARKITAELHPPLLDDLGLQAALEHFAGETERVSGVSCAVTLHDERSLSPRLSLATYRIVQEAVSNVLRHAKAAHIEIEGERVLQRYRLRVADDGIGFDPAAVRPDARGLANMRQRARLLGGRLAIDTGPGRGTRIVLEFPLEENERDEPADEPAAGR